MSTARSEVSAWQLTFAELRDALAQNDFERLKDAASKLSRLDRRAFSRAPSKQSAATRNVYAELHYSSHQVQEAGRRGSDRQS